MSRYARIALGLGILVPVLYYGVQLLAIPSYPGYDFMTQSASELGSPRSNRPWILNTGAIVTGAITVIAATAFPSALRRHNCWPFLAWLTAIAAVSMGLGAIKAGSFPLPDPRHSPGLLGAGAFVLPVIFPFALLRKTDSRGVKGFLFVNLLLFVLLIPIMSGKSGIDVTHYRGLLQRVAAAVLHVPFGVVSWALRQERGQ